MTIEKTWHGWHSFCILLLILTLPFVGIRIASTPGLAVWWCTVFFLGLLTLLIGHGVTGVWRGVLIDERNKMSLARFQMLFWTLLILSAYIAGVFRNLSLGESDPLAIAIPEEMWILMGISTTALVGSPLIQSTKKNKQAKREEMTTTMKLLCAQYSISQDIIDAKGQIIVNKNPKEARFADIFRGEETGNAGYVDLGKVQMFYFTLVLLLVYIIMIGNMFIQNDVLAIHSLPALNQSMLALLGISNAGYLTNKAIPHSQEK